MLIGLQLRYGTAAEWTAANPILAIGEEGHETDTGKRKIGDGVTAWSGLSYWSGGGAVATHASTHATGQSDALSPGNIGAEPARTAASQAEMEAGTEAAIRSVSPLRVAQAIAALAAGTKVFADATARAAAVPAYVGQLGLQLDTLVLYRGTALSAGSWTATAAAMVGADPAGTGHSEATAHVGTHEGSYSHAATARAPLAAVRHVFWPAGAAIPRTTNGAAAGTVEAATNDVMYDVFDFDSARDEGVAWVGYLEHWDAGTIKCRPVWTCAAGIGASGKTVCFAIKGRAYANDDAIDQDGGTPQSSTDTWIADGDIHIGPATAAITVGGSPANGQAIILQAIRDVSEDDLAGDARLLGVWIEYTEAATEEAAW